MNQLLELLSIMVDANKELHLDKEQAASLIRLVQSMANRELHRDALAKELAEMRNSIVGES